MRERKVKPAKPDDDCVVCMSFGGVEPIFLKGAARIELDRGLIEQVSAENASDVNGRF